jgi:rubrerythrin
MSEYSKLRDVIDVLTIAIAREEWEEQFFRRSAKATTYEPAGSMFAEIAEECASHLAGLEARKKKLEEALSNLSANKG